MLAAFLVAALLIALLLTRSGATKLQQYQAQLLAQGEILDLDQLAPKRTGKEPDGDEPLQLAQRHLAYNLTLGTGLFEPLLNTNNLFTIGWYSHPYATNHTQRSPLWTQAETEIAARRSELTLVSQALKNPPFEKGADYRLLYRYPQINYVLRRNLAQFLNSAVLADAHAGRSAHAATNLITLLDLCDLQRDEWSLINQMIRTALVKQTLHSLNYGLAAHTWAEPQLALFQARLESLSLITNLYQTLLIDRASGNRYFREVRSDPQLINVVVYNGHAGIAETFLARTWLAFDADEDEYAFLQYSQQQLETYRQQIASTTWAGVPATLQLQHETLFADTDNWLLSRQRWLSSLICPNLSRATSTLIGTETLRLQAITALALERHRLAHDHYPDTLTKLVPEFLAQVPQDPMDGRPMRYRLNADGTFTLWSIGFDGKDQGGDPAMTDPIKQKFPQDSRDLLWPRIDPIDLPPKL